ncbi:MAG: NAD(P)H-binding protein [Chitinophagales bacterium]
MKKTALIIGATGLVGEQCLCLLLSSGYYGKVIALTRKKLSITHAVLENPVVNFDQPDTYAHLVKADDIYCAIGTTIGKAGSQQAFKKVDFYLPLQVAQAAKANGAQTFVLVSSFGADASSGVFYSRIKGELEQALAQLHFQSLLIFRPSILLGDRKEKRTGEELGRWVAEKMPFLFAGPLKKYRGTPADWLARVMLQTAQQKNSGVRIIENEEIFILGEK